ncbi:hypothetical protein L6248_02570, partial [Candidatus Parcubacteria bacterium]|nr:hypothetical protein [Candidatus Parcubacteria bacterium]
FGDVALIAMQGRELGFKGTYLGGDTLLNPVLIDLAGDAVEGLVASIFFAEDEPPIPDALKNISPFRKGGKKGGFSR